ncbi:Uncharacterised protein [Mycobacteroides abscessus subsp. abscessus]|uniref:hypothetical protein n=1 Tax=Mycobacteroides abscessus TaxID=36809 RepID=UPI0009A663ED|nr:hypothetical protein [Mycobacteroides abscessus]SKU47612.1 Uncharacterised protein [Mycobacteroides abscessus subsp. abscessus]
MIPLSDGLKWPEYIQEFIDMGLKSYQSDKTLSQSIKDLSQISTWEGLSGHAARNALRAGHQTLDMNSEAARELISHAYKVHSASLDVEKGIRNIVQFSEEDPKILVDLDTNQVYPPNTSHLDPEKDAAEIKKIQEKYTLLQARMKTAEQALGIVDQDFSRVMQYATGQSIDPLPKWRQPPRIHGAAKVQIAAAGKGFAPTGDEDFPLPKQTLKEHDDKHGAPNSGIYKDPNAITRQGGNPLKVADPKGPKLWGDEKEGSQQRGWAEGKYGRINIGGRDVDFRWGARGPNIEGQVGLEAYEKAMKGELGGEVNLFSNDAEWRSKAGPVDLIVSGENKFGVSAHTDTTLNVEENGGIQGGGDVFAGYSEKKSVDANAWGIHFKDDVTGYAGAGGGLGGHIGKTDDGKWALGWNAGLAFGLGGKNHMEIVVDPSEVKEHLDDMWQWLSK